MAEPGSSDDPMKAIMEVLRQAQLNVPGLEGVSIISTDGLPMASAIDAKIGEGELAALASSMLAIGANAIENLKKGRLDSLFVKAERGFILLRYSGPLAVVVFITKEEARLGPLLLELKRTAEKFEKLLGFG